MTKTRYSLRVTKYYPSLISDLQEEADLLNISLNKLIIIILSNHLKKYKHDRIK